MERRPLEGWEEQFQRLEPIDLLNPKSQTKLHFRYNNLFNRPRFVSDVMAQLNREPEKDKGRLPRLSDLADSAQIERDGDCIGLLHRDRDPTISDAVLLLAKQRDGETGPIDLFFNGKFCRLENPPQQTPETHSDDN
jgi:hypothetical protein